MKRFHVHAHVADLPASIAFYSKMFASEPVRVETDYANGTEQAVAHLVATVRTAATR